MANLKEIRSRISSVGSTMQITNAMKMVSAAKLKRAQDAIVQLRPYAEKLREILNNLSENLDGDTGAEFTKTTAEGKVLLVAITSNRGLCGAFNSNVIKKVKQIAFEDSGAEYEIVTIGKKGNDILSKEYTIHSNHSSLWDNLTFDESSILAENLMQEFLEGKYSKIVLVYNQFKNAASQILSDETFLPITLDSSKEETSAAADYIFEPSKKEILEDLIPQTLKTQLFKALLDSRASEHGARMTAMHKATDNAQELRRDLVLQYNKERQAAITKEILEIVGGAEALDG